MDIVVPDLMGRPLIAFRRWRIADGRLTACYTDWAWIAGGDYSVGTCRPDLYRGGGVLNPGPKPEKIMSHQAPAKKCNCGLWGMFRPLTAHGGHTNHHYVIGAMLFTGRFQVYRNGVRAHKGKPAVLCLPPGTTDTDREAQEAVIEVADKYDAEIVTKTADCETKVLTMGDPVPEAVINQVEKQGGPPALGFGAVPWAFPSFNRKNRK